ncbi:DnaQ DNA polymerase III, epsilon subunit and related 3'-5' exonucleases [Candidatus Nanopelagicaceae bacterium]
MTHAPDWQLVDTTFAVLDLETSGGSPRSGAAITEIGVVKVRGGQVLGTFKSFVDPGHTLPIFITQLTGITDEMLISAPFIDEVLPTLFEFLGSPEETVLVAHNSPFDMSFLKAAALAHDYEWPHYLTIDTARLARAVLDRDEVINCKLVTLAEFFGAQTSPNHRALDDALATVDVLHGIIERLAGHGVTTFEEMRNFPSLKRRKAKRPISD